MQGMKCQCTEEQVHLLTVLLCCAWRAALHAGVISVMFLQAGRTAEGSPSVGMGLGGTADGWGDLL